MVITMRAPTYLAAALVVRALLREVGSQRVVTIAADLAAVGEVDQRRVAAHLELLALTRLNRLTCLSDTHSLLGGGTVNGSEGPGNALLLDGLGCRSL
jgi:hypothetical protein